MKDKIYRTPSDLPEGLKSAIRNEIHALNSNPLQRVMRVSDLRRLYTSIIGDGRHIEHLVYSMPFISLFNKISFLFLHVVFFSLQSLTFYHVFWITLHVSMYNSKEEMVFSINILLQKIA